MERLPPLPTDGKRVGFNCVGTMATYPFNAKGEPRPFSIMPHELPGAKYTEIPLGIEHALKATARSGRVTAAVYDPATTKVHMQAEIFPDTPEGMALETYLDSADE